ncbi:MAG TPA: hypothetical protein VNA16_09965 [Abditibacteriaceae bacterium]|nr:hypothetical protein [Abditibacteriaceae bacterium]
MEHLPLVALIIAFLFAWFRVDLKHKTIHPSMVSIVLGVTIFGYGLVGVGSQDKVLGCIIVTTGLVLALRGTAHLTAYLVIAALKDNNHDATLPL